MVNTPRRTEATPSRVRWCLAIREGLKALKSSFAKRSLFAKNNAARNDEFDFGSRPPGTADCQICSHSHRALLHSCQSEVPGLSFGGDIRIDPLPVVTHAQLEGMCIGQDDLHFGASGVGARIA